MCYVIKSDLWHHKKTKKALSSCIYIMSTSLATSSTSVIFVVGNTYKRISNASAKLDRSGRYKKVHDWTLYVDVQAGDPDLIQHVKFDLHSSFQPNSFTCSSPVNIIQPDGSRVSRFSTRQQSYGSFSKATIRILGRGGSTMSVTHTISLKRGGGKSDKKRFIENTSTRPFQYVKLNDKTTFGIELELSCSTGTQVDQISETIRSIANVPVNYYLGGSGHSEWKLVHDGSIVCNRNAPNCSKFELVSPILCGGEGLNEISRVLRSLQHLNCITVNKSMGFHVHVGVEGYTLQQLIKICKNFIKYEDAIDSFMPQSRRTGSDNSDRYCKSNKYALASHYVSNKERHNTFNSCRSINELCYLMNPEGRYYKLNLQNLASNRQETIEFRQHSGTSDFKKINAWIRFCVLFVTMSKRNVAPKCLKDSRGVEEEFDMLFEYVVKDRALKAFFVERRDQLSLGGDDACCTECSVGHECGGQCGVNPRREVSRYQWSGKSYYH